MKLARALRLDLPSTLHPVISLVGSGGKTTALFQLARQIKNRNLVIVTSTTHLGAWQIPLADHHIIAKDISSLQLPNEGVILVTGEIESERTKPVSKTILSWLYESSKKHLIPLVIEADGSRQKPLKAPAGHEPPIPQFSNMVIHVSGLSGLGKPLHEDHVQRAEIFSQLSGLPIKDPVTPQAAVKVITHPQGGLKKIPPNARRVALLNQADTPKLRSIAGGMAQELLRHFDSVVIGSLKQENFNTIECTAGIILAAGASSRYGSPKQLLDWKGKPFVRHVAETALQSGLEPVIIITGFHHADIESSLQNLRVNIVHNPDYAQGQSTSIKRGVRELLRHQVARSSNRTSVGGVIFLLADQPQIPAEIIRALTEAHARELPAILAPLVLEERRANPVLFDQATFPELLRLTGDVGGRALFSKYKVEYLPWHDEILLLDVDKPEDYQRLLDIEKT